MYYLKSLEFRLEELQDYANELADLFHKYMDEGNIYEANSVDQELEGIKERILNLENRIKDIKM